MNQPGFLKKQVHHAIAAFKDFRHAAFYKLILRPGVAPIQKMGDALCPWVIAPQILSASSVVYSAGVGNNISFERELAQTIGCDIVLLDPSPAAQITMEKPENALSRFHFFPVALAGHQGSLSLTPPSNGDLENGCWSHSTDTASSESIACDSVESVMKRHGHHHVDLLKLDIEGAEYDVIRHIIERRIDVCQICVEFHHFMGLPHIQRKHTIAAIFSLLRHGYLLISKDGENYTFVRKDALV